MSNLNINQFAQVPIPGQLDLNISQSGVVSGQISTNQATALAAGTFVDLDTANTAIGAPQFLSAASSDEAFGCLIYDVKTADPSTLAPCEVAMLRVGVCVWLQAGGSINPGGLVQQGASAGQVIALSSGKVRGIAIDPGTTGNLLRVVLIGSPS